MNKKTRNLIFWTPRILSIIFIIFLSLFSLDVITPEASLKEIIIGLFIHNIPVFALTIILIISWHYEIVGGIFFILAGLLYIGQMTINAINYGFAYFEISYSFIIAGPTFLIGSLFLIEWKKKSKKKN